MTMQSANLCHHGSWTRHRALVALLTTIAVSAQAGCASSHEGEPTPQPALSECYRGAYFADCGGDGTPRFGCAEGGGVNGCLWFTRGLVAEGYVGWSCADGQICCDDGAGPALPEDFALYAPWFFSTNGVEPWTRERALVLAVTVDSGLSGDLSVACERGGQVVDDVPPCRDPSDPYDVYTTRAVMRDTLSVGIQQSDGFGHRRLQVEFLPAEGLARACLLSTSDFVPTSCSPDDYPLARCATGGSIRVSELPARNEAALEGIVMAGEATFEDGLTITFTIPL
jgi:hypothetical protein